MWFLLLWNLPFLYLIDVYVSCATLATSGQWRYCNCLTTINYISSDDLSLNWRIKRPQSFQVHGWNEIPLAVERRIKIIYIQSRVHINKTVLHAHLKLNSMYNVTAITIFIILSMDTRNAWILSYCVQ